MNVRSVSHAGRLVAIALRGSWRLSPTSALAPADFEVITPLLYDSGAAGLGWWSVRETDLADSPSGELLHQAFRLLTLQAAIHETGIEKVFRCFRAANVEPILIKGWSVARRYLQPGLRPYGDIDLLIRPEDRLMANTLMASDDLRGCQIDLHSSVFELADRSIDDLFSRSRLAQCGGEAARLLCDEDEFALLAIHLLKHGAWRPLWLCDLALMLESIPSDFDWELCLGNDGRRKNWILLAIGLACELLDASVNDARFRERATVPRWLVQAVEENWATPSASMHEGLTRLPIKSYLQHPRSLLRDLVRHWPNPIRATIDVNGDFGRRQPLKYQIQDCLQRTARLIRPAIKSA